MAKHNLICMNCRTSYTAARKDSKYCSSACRVAGKRKRDKMDMVKSLNRIISRQEHTNLRPCEYCGRDMFGKYGGRMKKYCSNSCRTMAYRKREKLASD